MKRILLFVLIVVAVCALIFGVVEFITYLTHSERIGDWTFYIIASASTSFAITRSEYIKKFLKK